MPNFYTFGPETARRIKRFVDENDVPPVRREREVRNPIDAPDSGGSALKIGKADSDITAGSTGTVSLWQKNPSTGTLEDTGDNVTAYLDWMHGSEDVSSGKQVVIARFGEYGGIWRIIGAECE